MTPESMIAIAAIVLLVGGAVAYIIRSKKAGKRCIGCPYAKSCGGRCSTSSDSSTPSSDDKTPTNEK